MILLSDLEIFFRWALGLQLLFWGLNGVFHWVQIKSQPMAIEKFVGACIEVRFIMPLVKYLEILGGILLLINVQPQLALLLLYPIVGVVILLHLIHNLKKSYEVVLPLGIPFLFLTFYHLNWKDFL